MRNAPWSAAIVGIVSVGMVFAGCGGGGGSSGPARDDAKVAGEWTMAMLGIDWSASSSPYGWGGYFGLDFDGAGTLDVDEDLDDDYDEDSVPYAAYADGTMTVDSVNNGVFNAASDTAILSDADVADDEGSIIMAIKNGSGRTNASFTGDFVACQFGFDWNDKSHWTSRVAVTSAGDGTGTYSILADSSGSSGSGAIAYDMFDARGRFELTTFEEEGMLRQDGAVWFMSDYSDDDSDNEYSLMVGVKKGSGLDASIFSGTYIAVQIGGDDDDAGSRYFWTSRLQIIADGVDTVSYKILEDSGDDAGETGSTGFTVGSDGAMTLTDVGEGIISADGSLFLLVDTDWDPSGDDDDIWMMIGIKKQ